MLIIIKDQLAIESATLTESAILLDSNSFALGPQLAIINPKTINMQKRVEFLVICLFLNKLPLTDGAMKRCQVDAGDVLSAR
jgi:hypothetical protein